MSELSEVLQRLTRDEVRIDYLTADVENVKKLYLDIQTTLLTIDTRLHNIENRQYGRLSGSDKAIVYGSFLTMMGVIAVELIGLFL
jgi:hypothetical protein